MFLYQAQPGWAVGYQYAQFFPYKIPKYLKIEARRNASNEKY